MAQALIASYLTLWVPLAGAAWFEDDQAIMGTRVRAELWSEDVSGGRRLLAAVMAEMRRIEAAFSPYLPDSELSRLNREAGKGWLAVSAELFELLDKSRMISELTHGAFDITYASAGRYYDYRQGTRPDEALLALAVQSIDYRHVELDRVARAVRFARPEVYVDLGGIAKGYAVDRCAQMLIEAGVGHGSVSAGGDTRIIGDRRGNPWTVGVRDPRDERAMVAVLPLADTAVSTSGDYERYFEQDGVRYHHILDPRTGDSARQSWSVTVLGSETTFTDALSTSVFVLGPDKGLELVNRLPDVDAIIVDASGELRYSDDLAELSPVE